MKQFHKRRKYTESKDGTPRTNVYVKIRLDKKEIATLEVWAAEQGNTVEEAIRSEAGLAIDGLIDQIESGER